MKHILFTSALLLLAAADEESSLHLLQHSLKLLPDEATVGSVAPTSAFQDLLATLKSVAHTASVQPTALQTQSASETTQLLQQLEQQKQQAQSQLLQQEFQQMQQAQQASLFQAASPAAQLPAQVPLLDPTQQALVQQLQSALPPAGALNLQQQSTPMLFNQLQAAPIAPAAGFASLALPQQTGAQSLTSAADAGVLLQSQADTLQEKQKNKELEKLLANATTKNEQLQAELAQAYDDGAKVAEELRNAQDEIVEAGQKEKASKLAEKRAERAEERQHEEAATLMAEVQTAKDKLQRTEEIMHALLPRIEGSLVPH